MDAQPAHHRDQQEVSIEDMLATRLSVSSVTIRGARRTDPKLLDYIIQPVISTGGTFEGVVEDISTAVETLRSTGCFKGVDALLDRSEQGDAAVQFTINEKSLYQIHTGTTIETSGDRDACLEGSFLWRNVRGHADTLKATVGWMGAATPASFGKFPSSMWDLSYESPFVLGLQSSFFAKLGTSLHNHEDKSSYNLHVKRGEAGFQLPVGRVWMSSAWREVANVDEKASQLIQEEAGHTWKTSLHHRFENDARDNPSMPTSGLYGCVDSEWALPILGDTSFGKVEVSQQVHVPLGKSGAVVSIAAREGVVTGRGRRVGVQDRFFLGGSNSMRGFESRGVGPRDGADSIGGDVFYSLMGMFSVAMPESSLLAQLFNARMHVFGCVGDLGDLKAVKEATVFGEGGSSGLKEDLGRMWSDVYGSMRVAVGLGVALETSVGRVEMNYCQTIRSAEGDRGKQGIQIGISESFL